jgi:HEAT repeat protein
LQNTLTIDALFYDIMKYKSALRNNLIGVTSSLLLLASGAFAQAVSKVYVPDKVEAEPVDQTFTYVIVFGLIITLAGAIYWKYKGHGDLSAARVSGKGLPQKHSGNSWDDQVDADKEMEWLRRNKKVVNKRDPKRYPKNLPRPSEVLNKTNAAPMELDSEQLLEKIQKFQFGQLPVNSFLEIKPSRAIDMLPLSNDQALMSAIEQVHDEFEEDEEVRGLAVRILAAFKTRNSVEALAQTALYDLSSNLRSKAVSILTDFDHPLVFEALLLACADPTREVRAAAARGIFRLSFDRADAWCRLMETNDDFRMRHAARAATEANLVRFERLVHEDIKVAYEAFALTALLLKAGETKQIFDALQNHSDVNVQKALLQVFKVTREPNALEGLYALLEATELPLEIRQEADALVAEIGLVAA